jgi:hypothetical protein
VMDGDGLPGANPRQQVVPTTSPRTVEVRATYTPVGGTPVVRRVFVHVVDFALRVQGRTPQPPGGNVFPIRRQAGGSVRVVAELSFPPFCVPSTLVSWAPDDPATRLDDPLQRRVSIDQGGETRLRATVAGITREVVIRVFDLAFVANTAPFDARLNPVRWNTAVRVMAELPGETRDEVTVTVTSFLIRH